MVAPLDAEAPVTLAFIDDVQPYVTAVAGVVVVFKAILVAVFEQMV